MADRRSKGARRPAPPPKRGEIYIVALDPTVGHEIKKTRPALVIQNDTMNEHFSTTIVAPITSVLRVPLSPVHVLIPARVPSGLAVTSMALCDQIRTIDKRRLLKRLGHVDVESLEAANAALKISLGL